MSCCIGISNKVMKVMGCSVLWIFLSMWFFLSKLPHGNNGIELAVTDVEIRTPERWHDDIQEQHNFWNTFDFALNGTSEAKIVLVLQANVVGGTMIFLQNILTPNCMVVTPMAPIKTIYSASKIGVNVSVKFGSVFARTTFPKLLSFLAAKKDMFDKILINHPLGFPLDFLRALFEMNKRYISITHDYVWVLDNVQPTFAEMRKPGGTSRNYVFKPMLPKLELKSQHIATKTMFGFMDQFESLQVVTMPDYVSSQNVSVETNQTDLVIGVLGNISFIKGLQAVLDISRQRASPTESPSCRSIETGPNYIQLGNWRFGQTSATHLSISHRNNQTPTPAVFRSDGSVQLNPSEKTQRKHSLWTTRGGQCHGSNDGLVKFGKTFLQIGDWRLGQSGGDLVLCHREKKSKPISLGHKQQNASISNAVNIWDHELENMSSVVSGSAVGGFDFLKLDDWLLLYKEDELVIVHQYDGPVQSFRSNGKNKKFNQKDRTGNFMVDTSKLYDSSGSCNVPRNVQVVVFGGMGSICGAGNNLHTHQYDNISHFNSLIRKFKPNVFIITSIWPETYSYTLTLAMLTNIPIIVRKTATDFSAAVVERAQQYPKAYFHDFENIESVVTLARKIKATSFTEVSPQLFVPPQWKNLMHPHLFNVVLVASKIITSKNPLWYAKNRSRFSAPQRFEQTLETIRSIRSKIPHSFVVLIDNSELTHVQLKTLRSSVDVLINDVNNEELRQATDKAEAKQLGEAKLLLQGLAALEQHQVMFKQLFKLTGRYLINEDFRFGDYDNAFNIFKLADKGISVKLGKSYYAYTSFFKIYFNHTGSFEDALNHIVSDLTQMIAKRIPVSLHDDIESRLSLMIPNVKFVRQLGITQRISTRETEDTNI